MDGKKEDQVAPVHVQLWKPPKTTPNPWFLKQRQQRLRQLVVHGGIRHILHAKNNSYDDKTAQKAESVKNEHDDNKLALKGGRMQLSFKYIIMYLLVQAVL